MLGLDGRTNSHFVQLKFPWRITCLLKRFRLDTDDRRGNIFFNQGLAILMSVQFRTGQFFSDKGRTRVCSETYVCTPQPGTRGLRLRFQPVGLTGRRVGPTPRRENAEQVKKGHFSMETSYMLDKHHCLMQ